MPLISETVDNLLNGVSQQPPQLRRPSQAADQLNGYSSVVDGLRKRPPTEHLAKMFDTPGSKVWTHLIERDSDERYMLIIADGALKIFNADTGEEETVNTTSPAGDYLDASHNKYEAVTVNDTTFLVNKQKTVTINSAESPAIVEEGLINVDVAVERTQYVVDINNVQEAYYLTGAAGSADIETQTIAADLATDLSGSANLTGWTIQRRGSTIYVKPNTGTLKMFVRDGYGNQAMTGYYKRVRQFTDLPNVAKDDMIFRVMGDTGIREDDYYVKFNADNSAVSMSTGIWQETIAPGQKYTFDKETMPHVIVRESDGTFTFRQGTEWVDREVGDFKSNPTPSFVNRKINYVFFWQNRLGFLSEDNVIMSQAGDFFNFWKTTAIDVLDSDPIDVSANDEKVAILKSAKPMNEELHLFAEGMQYSISTLDGTLSASSIELKPVSSYDLDLRFTDLASTGASVFLPQVNGDYTKIREYTVRSDIDRVDAPSITEHVGKLIPALVKDMAASANDQMLAVIAGSNEELFIFKYFGSIDQRLQSSWSRWDFSTDVTFRSVDFLEDKLLLVFDVPDDGIYFECMTLGPGIVDSDGTYQTLLDRRITITEDMKSYDSATDRTTITLPANVMSVVGDCSGPLVVERAALWDGTSTPYLTRTSGPQTILITPTNWDGEYMGEYDPDPGPFVGSKITDSGITADNPEPWYGVLPRYQSGLSSPWVGTAAWQKTFLSGNDHLFWNTYLIESATSLLLGWRTDLQKYMFQHLIVEGGNTSNTHVLYWVKNDTVQSPVGIYEPATVAQLTTMGLNDNSNTGYATNGTMVITEVN